MTPGDILEQRRAQLARLAPLKAEHEARASKLWDKRRGLKAEIKDRTEERNVTEGHPLDLFPTPPGLASRMVVLGAEHAPDACQWLEPSAGTGRIAEEIRRAGYGVHCVELNYKAAQLLESRGFIVSCLDFLDWSGSPNIVIMNPPFSNGQDIDHVLHAFDLLAPGGRIVAIMSAGTFYRSDKKAVSFRKWLDLQSGISEELPEGTFKTSGTMVNARLVIIDKEERIT